jgi:hypothetical protein
MINKIRHFFNKQKETRYFKLPDFKTRRRCMLWIEKQREKITFITYLPLRKIPVGTFPVKYKGEPTYIIGIDKKGSYPISLDSTDEDSVISPLDLFEAISCDGPTYEIWGFSMSTETKVKLGIFIALILAMLIIIFMMSAQFMGA